MEAIEPLCAMFGGRRESDPELSCRVVAAFSQGCCRASPMPTINPSTFADRGHSPTVMRFFGSVVISFITKSQPDSEIKTPS
jgi:hypothetical protein